MEKLVKEALAAKLYEPPEPEPMTPSEGPAARQTSTGAWLRALPHPSPEQGVLGGAADSETSTAHGTQFRLFPDDSPA